MKTGFTFILLLIFLISCKNNIKSDRDLLIKQLDSLSILMEGKNLQKFDFKDLNSNDVWKWQNHKGLIKVDSSLLNESIMNSNIFSERIDYQDLYWIGVTKINLKKYFVLAQWIHNGDESKMYLIGFDENGIINESLKVASQFKAPEDYIYCNSNFIGNNLKRTTIKLFADIGKNVVGYKDSIIEIIELNGLKVVKYDSIRIK